MKFLYYLFTTVSIMLFLSGCLASPNTKTNYLGEDSKIAQKLTNDWYCTDSTKIFDGVTLDTKIALKYSIMMNFEAKGYLVLNIDKNNLPKDKKTQKLFEPIKNDKTEIVYEYKRGGKWKYIDGGELYLEYSSDPYITNISQPNFDKIFNLGLILIQNSPSQQTVKIIELSDEIFKTQDLDTNQMSQCQKRYSGFKMTNDAAKIDFDRLKQY
ncbi:MAG: hypothetical protein ACK5LP_10255 [Campylobacteraceae bacterium]